MALMSASGATPRRFASTISRWFAGSGRQIDEQCFGEAGRVRMRESAVVAALEADARERVAREPAAADRTAVVARVDEDVVGELEQALDRGVQLLAAGSGLAAGMQVGTTDVARRGASRR